MVKYTPQYLFDKAYIGVVRQKSKSEKVTGMCAYRGVGGKKCAVGHLITDKMAEKWDALIGDSDICNVVDRVKPPTWVKQNVELLHEIQKAHDFAEKKMFIVDFKLAMNKVAERYGLTVPELV